MARFGVEPVILTVAALMVATAIVIDLQPALRGLDLPRGSDAPVGHRAGSVALHAGAGCEDAGVAAVGELNPQEGA